MFFVFPFKIGEFYYLFNLQSDRNASVLNLTFKVISRSNMFFKWDPIVLISAIKKVIFSTVCGLVLLKDFQCSIAQFQKLYWLPIIIYLLNYHFSLNESLRTRTLRVCLDNLSIKSSKFHEVRSSEEKQESNSEKTPPR